MVTGFSRIQIRVQELDEILAFIEQLENEIPEEPFEEILAFIEQQQQQNQLENEISEEQLQENDNPEETFLQKLKNEIETPEESEDDWKSYIDDFEKGLDDQNWENEEYL